MSKSISINQDIGGGWRLISITQEAAESKIVDVVLTLNGKTINMRFDTLTGSPLNSVGLTTIQLHIIATAATQLLR